MNTDELENRLSALKLRTQSDAFIHNGEKLIQLQARQKQRSKRLNYVLAFTLLLSMGFNLLQLQVYQHDTGELSALCEINRQARLEPLPVSTEKYNSLAPNTQIQLRAQPFPPVNLQHC